jgi:ABC-2 type transport system permease protein
MLWYKAWLETRTRFLLALAAITLLAGQFIYRQVKDALPTSGPSYYSFVLHNGHQIIVLLWIMALTMLMMGGVVREKAVGASSFTLALPVSRRRIMWTRIATGLVETVALAVIPWSVMYVIANAAGKPVAFEQAAIHVTLMLSGGVFFFAVAVFCSSLLEGEYTVPLVALGVLAGVAVGLNDPPFRTYSPWYMLFGTNLLDRKTQLLTGPIPWPIIAGFATLAVVILLASVAIVERREF